MIIEIMLGISIAINLLLGWYTYKLIRDMVELTDEFENMRVKLIEFSAHLKGVNDMETFYGDPTLTALLNHMKDVGEYIESYTKMMVLYEDVPDDEEEREVEQDG